MRIDLAIRKRVRFTVYGPNGQYSWIWYAWAKGNDFFLKPTGAGPTQKVSLHSDHKFRLAFDKTNSTIYACATVEGLSMAAQTSSGINRTSPKPAPSKVCRSSSRPNPLLSIRRKANQESNSSLLASRVTRHYPIPFLHVEGDRADPRQICSGSERQPSNSTWTMARALA